MRAIVLSAAACVLSLAAQAAPVYSVAGTVPLGAPDRWDYVSFDAASGHVLVAHGDHTDIVDPGTLRIVGKLEGLQGAHGQAVSATGQIYADSGKTGQLTEFDAKTGKALKTLPAGQDADAVIADPADRLIAVMDGDAATATLITTDTQTLKATVKLGGGPEFAAADGAGHIFINIADTGEVAKLDTASGTVSARFKAPDCTSPHGLALDPQTQRLFTTCLNRKLLVIDAHTGTLLQSLAIGRGTDAAAFDPVHHLVFSSNGEGTLSVFAEDAHGMLTPLGDVPTAKGARTMATDPATGRIFLVTADVAGELPGGHGGLVPHFSFTPGSVHLLILKPAHS